MSSASRCSPSFINPSSASIARQLEAERARYRDPTRAIAEKAYLESDLAFLGVLSLAPAARGSGVNGHCPRGRKVFDPATAREYPPYETLGGRWKPSTTRPP